MCRSKELGGRRCSSAHDPEKVASYNARRREKYALTKVISPETAALFAPLHEVHHLTKDMERKHWSEAGDFAGKANKLALWDKWTMPIHFDNLEYGDPMQPENILPYYTEGGYEKISNHLNGFRIHEDIAEYREHNYTPKQTAWLADVVAKMDGLLEKATPPEEPRVLYRGMAINYTVKKKDVRNWVAENFPVGGIISQKSYMSTTLSAGTASRKFAYSIDPTSDRSVIMEFVTKQGAPLGETTSFLGQTENEVLMPREAKFKVVSVDYGVPYKVGANFYTTDQVSEGKRTVIRLVDASED
jgi:hypothetical protein